MSLPPDFSAVPSGPPPPPPGWVPGQPPPPRPQSVTSRWGIGDIVLGLVFIIAAVVVATIVAVAITGFDTLEALADGDLSGVDAIVFLALTTVAQAGAMGVWPVMVARWKGAGVAADFGWRFRVIDIAYGLGVSGVLLFFATGMAYLVGWLLGVDPTAEETTNTQIVTDAADGPALAIVVVAAVVVAPIVEELFFRGLCLRAIERRFGTIAAVVLSSVLFTLPHFTNPSLAGTAVLFSAIFTVGLVLAALTVKTGRLGAAVVAHAVFNAVGVAAALAAG